jgi:hypothetical protein
MEDACDRRLQALGDFIAECEAEHGPITDAELEEVTRSVRARVFTVCTRDASAGRAEG